MNIVKEKNYRLISNILYVYKGVAVHKPYLIFLLLISVISTAGSRFIWLFLSKYIIEYIIVGMEISKLIIMVVILTGLNILCMIGQNAVNFGKEPAALYVRPMFMLERNKKHISMPYEYLEYKEVLNAIEKSRRSTSWVESGIEGLIRFTIVLFSDLFTCIVAVAVLCRISVLMIFVVTGFGIVSYFSIDKAAKKEKYLTNDSVAGEERKKQYFNKVTRDFSYGKDIRLYQIQEKLMDTQNELNKKLHEKNCMARSQWIKSGIFTGTMDMFREAAMYLVIVYYILEKGISISSFTLYIGCVRNFAQTLQNVMRVYTNMRKCSREVNDYRTFNEFCGQEENYGAEVEKSSEYEFCFENVSFRYPGADSYALKNVSITIKSKQKLAVVGLNGAGKTTFIKLLLGLYEPTEGRIYLNGADIKKYSRKSRYKLFSPVFQDMEYYAFSLAENVSMSTKENTDMLKVKRCLLDAGLADKLNEWEKGLDTNLMKILHNDGIILSGGERQKLALARALYKDAPVIILDEPTAALDAVSESKIYENFNDMVLGKTAVYISHRLASTRFCDEIAMFDGGEIIEYGSHDELLKKNGRYAEMFEMQAHYYKEDTTNEEEQVKDGNTKMLFNL